MNSATTTTVTNTGTSTRRVCRSPSCTEQETNGHGGAQASGPGELVVVETVEQVGEATASGRGRGTLPQITGGRRRADHADPPVLFDHDRFDTSRIGQERPAAHGHDGRTATVGRVSDQHAERQYAAPNS